MKLLAPVIGLAGMELLPNSSALADFSITKIPMPVTGHPMSEAARSTHSVPRILMPTYPSAPLVKDTGLVKEDILVFNVAQPLLFLTNKPADVWHLLLKIAKPQQLLKRLLRRINSVEKAKVLLVPPRLVVPNPVLNPNPALNPHPALKLNSVHNLRVVQNSPAL